MAHTRVFVTYVPNRWARQGAARAQGSLLAPATAVFAGALLAGSASHSLAGTDVAQPRSVVTAVNSDPVFDGYAQAVATPEAPSFLALVSVDAKQWPAPVAARSMPASAAKAIRPTPPAVVATPLPRPAPEPVAAPRRDLEGFLADQGLTLAEARHEPAVAADNALAALEAGTAVPIEAIASPAVTTDPAPDSAATQSFPMVQVDGATLGAVTVRGDTVHLGGLLGLLALKMPAEEYARLQAAPAADSFVSLATLRAAGLSVVIEASGERLTLDAV